MQNIDLKFEGRKLVIRIDLDQANGPSKSGKTISIASTHGNVSIDEANFPGVKLGLNCYRSKE